MEAETRWLSLSQGILEATGGPWKLGRGVGQTPSGEPTLPAPCCWASSLQS